MGRLQGHVSRSSKSCLKAMVRSDEDMLCFHDCGDQFFYVGYKKIKKEESTELGSKSERSWIKTAMWSKSWRAAEDVKQKKLKLNQKAPVLLLWQKKTTCELLAEHPCQGRPSGCWNYSSREGETGREKGGMAEGKWENSLMNIFS